MAQTPRLPDSPNPADISDDGRLFAPSAQRNMSHISEIVVAQAPTSGQALEIASGTGEHLCHFASQCPSLRWTPSDPDPIRRRSIAAHATHQGLSNVAPALALDAAQPGWSTHHGGQDLIVLVNLLHLISTPKARTILGEIAKALTPTGVFVLYGPFLRDGQTTSDGDARFDTTLRAQDPTTGYKDIADVLGWLAQAGLGAQAPIKMPANNLCIISQNQI